MADNETKARGIVGIPDVEAYEMLKKMAGSINWNYGTFLARLIREEYARMYSSPQPCVTVQEAVSLDEKAARG